jgi:O-antigen/teichoic acid export membrane protein
VMLALSAALVPLWGIVGAAVAAAVTNVGVNGWNLLEVRRVLGLSPYNHGYLRLLPPAVLMLVVTLALKAYAEVFRHDWLAVGVALAAAYAVFAAAVLVSGLDKDDRLIARAIWSRVRGAFAGATTGVQS